MSTFHFIRSSHDASGFFLLHSDNSLSMTAFDCSRVFFFLFLSRTLAFIFLYFLLDFCNLVAQLKTFNSHVILYRNAFIIQSYTSNTVNSASLICELLNATSTLYLFAFAIANTIASYTQRFEFSSGFLILYDLITETKQYLDFVFCHKQKDQPNCFICKRPKF